MRHKTKIFLATITLLYAFFASITETSFAVGQDSLEGATPTADQIIEATGIQGGLVVHLGCRGGELAEQFGRCDGFLVCGLDRSAEQVAAARAKIQSEDLYGKVSINRWEGTTLPLIDNLVNLLVIEGDAPARDEILRVLAPKGVAYIRTGNRWESLVKPRPAEMDQWTHYMYDAGGNAVSSDSLVGPPKHMQWVGSPRWSRHHDHMASMSAMVSAGGRVFYIFDEGSTSSITLGSHWKLIARDAFNGVVLWKQPIPRWWTRFQSLKSGPAQFPRRLVADDRHVYTTLSLGAPVTQLDAASGDVLQVYDCTKGTEEIIHTGDLLITLTGPPRAEQERILRGMYEQAARAPGNPINLTWSDWDRTIVAVDPKSGQQAWSMKSTVLPNTLAADNGSVYFHNGTGVVAVEKATGRQRWESAPVATCKDIPTGFAPTLVVKDGTIVYAGGDDYRQHMRCVTDSMTGIRASDGEILWSAPHPPSGYQSPEDVLVLGNTVWTPTDTWGKKDLLTGTELTSGKQTSQYNSGLKDPSWFIHHRCHRGKATEKYLLLSLEGVEFVEPDTKKWQIHHWIRGGCIYGIMPANGLLYAPMHNCACSSEVMLNGLKAVAGTEARLPLKAESLRSVLTKGSAYGKIEAPKKICPTDWPTYRNNETRNGVATCDVAAKLQASWKTEIGGRLTAPVVAGGKLYVASVDTHTLYALDSKTGETCWTFTTGGRIDSPPTIYKGMVLMGSRDGCVYCLRATDGELAWRFRARGLDQQLMAWEQLESVWPIHGSILIRDGEAWFVAGRSVYLDGGLEMFRLQPETGNVIAQTTLDGRAADGSELTGAQMKNVVGSTDVLSSVGENVFMRSGIYRPNGETIVKIDEKVPHLFSPFGFLDDSWFHRSYWLYERTCSKRHSYSTTGRTTPAGRILVYDDSNVYGFGRKKQYFNWTTPMEYRLFAESKTKKPMAGNRRKAAPASQLHWEAAAPMLTFGLVLAGDTLFAAGAPDVLDETMPKIRYGEPETVEAIKQQEAALAGRQGGILMAVSKTDGTVINRIDIDSPPVFDGLIAAEGNLYMSRKDGTVQCLEGK